MMSKTPRGLHACQECRSVVRYARRFVAECTTEGFRPTVRGYWGFAQAAKRTEQAREAASLAQYRQGR